MTIAGTDLTVRSVCKPLNLKQIPALWSCCEGPHSVTIVIALQSSLPLRLGSNPISKDPTFTDCVILEKDAFDPDALFLDDIVDDDVLPKLSLAVDGLTSPVDGGFELQSEDTAANRIIQSSPSMPVAALDPEQLEVYGWESSIWRKIRGYLGF